MPYGRSVFVDDDTKRVCADDAAESLCMDDTKAVEETVDTLLAGANQTRPVSIDSLCDEIGFIYTNRLIFQHESDVRNIILLNYDLADPETPRTDIRGDSYKDSLLSGQTHIDLSLRYINNAMGYGLFSSSIISEGSYLGEYCGVVLSIERESRCEPPRYSVEYPCCDNGFEINASEYGSLMRFINHSTSPNAEFRHIYHSNIAHVICVCTREIPVDTQITVDYGASYWEAQIEPPAPVT